MGIIKKIINLIKGKYRGCGLCYGFENHFLKAPGFQPFTSYEGIYTDSQGNIRVPCPACKGTGIIWE